MTVSKVFRAPNTTELFRGLKELQDIAYASVLILILIFFPKGLAALPGMLWRRRDAAKPESG